MADLTRAIVHLDPNLYMALRLKAAETDHSVADLVNQAVRQSLAEDADDLAAFDVRAEEANLAFDDAVRESRRRGKL